MKLARNGISLFPKKLTSYWPDFIDDYMRIHEIAHNKMQNNMDISWNIMPKTIDEFIESCDKRRAWEKKTNRVTPLVWPCIITTSLLEEIAREIKGLKNE